MLPANSSLLSSPGSALSGRELPLLGYTHPWGGTYSMAYHYRSTKVQLSYLNSGLLSWAILVLELPVYLLQLSLPPCLALVPFLLISS